MRQLTCTAPGTLLAAGRDLISTVRLALRLGGSGRSFDGAGTRRNDEDQDRDDGH
jgi:hypothetical protein